MGEHFVLLVDRLLTESTLEAAIESKNMLKQTEAVTINEMINCSSTKDLGGDFSSQNMVECRICQDEDFDSHMEIPCSCCGSLKFAHRKCVQRWCNEKGDTTCEICHQQFKPGYTAPPPMFRLGGLPMNMRGNWQITRRDLNNPHIIAMVATDQSYLDSDHHDHYAVPTARSIACCRSVAMLFMVLLILRHTLPVIVSEAGNYSFPLLLLLMLRVTGIILPICVILKAVTSVLNRRHQQVDLTVTMPASREEEDEEEEEGGHLPHVITL